MGRAQRSGARLGHGFGASREQFPALEPFLHHVLRYLRHHVGQRHRAHARLGQGIYSDAYCPAERDFTLVRSTHEGRLWDEFAARYHYFE